MVFTVKGAAYCAGDHRCAKQISSCAESPEAIAVQKNRIGRRVLIGDLRHRRLRSQIAGTQNLNDQSRDDGETENEFSHAAKNKRTAHCLSVGANP